MKVYQIIFVPIFLRMSCNLKNMKEAKNNKMSKGSSLQNERILIFKKVYLDFQIKYIHMYQNVTSKQWHLRKVNDTLFSKLWD